MVFLFLATTLLACSAAPRAIYIDPTAASPLDIDAWLAAHPLPEGQNILATVLRRSASSSTHIIQVRFGETPHLHATHDLQVTVLRGHGVLHLGERALPMNAGDAAVVPMGTPHYFVNQAASPSVALATFAPAYDGKDQVQVTPGP